MRFALLPGNTQTMENPTAPVMMAICQCGKLRTVCAMGKHTAHAVKEMAFYAKHGFIIKQGEKQEAVAMDMCFGDCGSPMPKSWRHRTPKPTLDVPGVHRFIPRGFQSLTPNYVQWDDDKPNSIK